MKIAVIGTGYVGLATGIVMAYLGHEVTCLDVDAEKIQSLQNGIIPIHEPFLQELLVSVKKNLKFTQLPELALPRAEIIFITLGTPPLADGSPDLQYLNKAAQDIGKNLGNHFTVIVNKSTLPIGSGNLVEALIEDSLAPEKKSTLQSHFVVVSNPEFLREGSALGDMLYPDRIVLGSDHSEALKILSHLYQPILEQNFSPPKSLPRPTGKTKTTLLVSDLISAELIKYAANAFLAMKISFINEMACLSEKVGADILQVADGIGMDSRIGNRFLEAGVGWGGSCFGKDTAALTAIAREYGMSLPLIEATREVNQRQRHWVIEKLLAELKILKGKNIGLLGLSFKPGTDDIRDAPALEIAIALLDRGARVRVNDPVAMNSVKKIHPGLNLVYCEDPQEVSNESDGLILVTEWPQYSNLSWTEMGKRMRNRLFLDGRNFLQRNLIEQAGFKYIGVGR